MALLFVSGTWSVYVTKSDFPLNLVYSVRCFDVALSRWIFTALFLRVRCRCMIGSASSK